MDYVGFLEFPKALYHADGSVVTVKDRAAQDALGSDWRETPAQPELEPVKRKRGKKDGE